MYDIYDADPRIEIDAEEKERMNLIKEALKSGKNDP
jgi:hypothetical protein